MNDFVSPPPRRIGVAAMLRLVAVAAFTFMAVCVKLSGEDGMPVMQIVFFRFLAGFIPLLIYIRAVEGFGALRTRRPLAHVVRAAFGIVGMITFFIALRMIPLTELTALNFTIPLFVTALSAPVLREKVPPHLWAAVLAGFIGVVVILRPSPEHLIGLGAAFGLFQAFLGAAAHLTIRQLGATETGAAVVFYYTLAATIAGAIALPFVWVTPSLATLAWLILAGIAGGVGQITLTLSYRYAPAAVVAPFDYTSILWAAGLGYLIWDERPTTALMVGGLIVIASGFYIVKREGGRKAAA